MCVNGHGGVFQGWWQPLQMPLECGNSKVAGAMNPGKLFVCHCMQTALSVELLH